MSNQPSPIESRDKQIDEVLGSRANEIAVWKCGRDLPGYIDEILSREILRLRALRSEQPDQDERTPTS